jgi:hypothetical protein
MQIMRTTFIFEGLFIMESVSFFQDFSKQSEP